MVLKKSNECEGTKERRNKETKAMNKWMNWQKKNVENKRRKEKRNKRTKERRNELLCPKPGNQNSAVSLCVSFSLSLSSSPLSLSLSIYLCSLFQELFQSFFKKFTLFHRFLPRNVVSREMLCCGLVWNYNKTLKKSWKFSWIHTVLQISSTKRVSL